MGQAADDLLEGDCCESCGEWLGGGEGYPRQCAGCKSPGKIKKQRTVKPKPKPEDKQLGFL
jgi:hypothetical protein